MVAAPARSGPHLGAPPSRPGRPPALGPRLPGPPGAPRAGAEEGAPGAAGGRAGERGPGPGAAALRGRKCPGDPLRAAEGPASARCPGLDGGLAVGAVGWRPGRGVGEMSAGRPWGSNAPSAAPQPGSRGAAPLGPPVSRVKRAGPGPVGGVRCCRRGA